MIRQRLGRQRHRECARVRFAARGVACLPLRCAPAAALPAPAAALPAPAAALPAPAAALPAPAAALPAPAAAAGPCRCAAGHRRCAAGPLLRGRPAAGPQHRCRLPLRCPSPLLRCRPPLRGRPRCCAGPLLRCLAALPACLAALPACLAALPACRCCAAGCRRAAAPLRRCAELWYVRAACRVVVHSPLLHAEAALCRYAPCVRARPRGACNVASVRHRRLNGVEAERARGSQPCSPGR